MPKERQVYGRGQKEDVESILIKNKTVPFVDRILNPGKYPVLNNKDGSVSSHLMGYGETAGRFFVYPTLQYIKKGWVNDEDPSDALLRDNVIFFDDEKSASEFAAGSWKKYKSKE